MMNNNIHTLLCLFVSVLIVPLTLSGQLSGHVNYDQLGIEFDIPEAWFGQEGDEAIILGSNTIPGVVLITTHNYTKEQLIGESRSGIIDQNGTNLQLEGSLKSYGEHGIGGVFNGTSEYQPAKVYVLAMVNPNGGLGVSIYAMSTPESFSDAHKIVCEQLFQSFKFKKIEKSSELEEWKTWLSNVRLTYMDSYYSPSSTSGGIGGGYSSEEKIDLCSKGYFNHSSYSGVSLSGSNATGYNHGSNQGQGTWKIVLNANAELVLLLNFYNGEESSYTLTYSDQKFYLNGYRYYRTTEGDYAPNCY